MNRQIIALNIDGFSVELSSAGKVHEAFNKIRKDFSVYLVHKVEQAQLKVEVFDGPINKSSLHGLKFRKIFRRCQSAEKGPWRYNKYDESTYVKYDYHREKAEVFASNPADQHELCYLIILSRFGKKMDRMGCHRLHAMAGVYQDKPFALSMDMGHGKSTLAFEMLWQKKIKLISDDAPYIDKKGRLCPSLLRMGLGHPEHIKKLKNSGLTTYVAQRRNYPNKELMSLAQLESSQLETHAQNEFTLFFGVRTKGDDVKVRKCSSLRAFFLLLRPMVIGVGLPILAEYFWEFGIKDFFVKTGVALSRLQRAAALAKNKTCYRVEFGDSLENNIRAVFEALER